MPQNDAAILAYTVFVSSNVIGVSSDTSDIRNIVKKTPVMNDVIIALELSFLGFMVFLGVFLPRPCVRPAVLRPSTLSSPSRP